MARLRAGTSRITSAHTLAWALWATTAAQVVFGLGLGALNQLGLARFFAEYVVAMSAGALAFASVGVLVVARQPRNTTGWLFCVLGVGFGTGWMTEYARLGLVVAPGVLPGAELVNWLNRWLWMPLLALVAVYLPLLFPDGRLPTPRWRLVGWLAAIAAAAMALAFAIEPGPIDASQPDVPNPFAPTWAPIVLPILHPIALALAAASLLSGACAAVVRFRRAREVERQQIKWFACAVGVLVVAILGPLLVGFPHATDDTFLSGVLLSVGFPAIPVATGLAILRHGLFDIDRLIDRTLVYGALTVCVVGVYTFVVGYLGTLFRTGDNLAISLAATGLVAVLFHPLRDHLQRAVNRLVYGLRDEPYGLLAGLDRQLAGALAPDAVLPTIADAVRHGLRLSAVAISVQAADGEQILTTVAGVPGTGTVELPLTYQGELVGTLVLGTRGPGEPLTPRDRRVLEDLARHAGAAVHGVRLMAELRRSRERLVVAREEERRRLRRDLHDELAPTLAGLGLTAATVDRLIPTEPTRAQEVARALHAAIRSATGEIRRLAHDLRPPALDELGLVEALRERVAQYDVADGHGEVPLPRVSVELATPLPSLPAAVEVAAYRIVQEALMNVVRHAHASSCVVQLASIAGSCSLQIDVRDDGVGLPDTYRPGVGLRSMRERAEELGGRCCVERLPGRGTRVQVWLPLSGVGGGA